MERVYKWLKIIPPAATGKVLAVGGTILGGVLIIRILLSLVTKTLLRRATEHNRQLGRNVIIYSGTIIVFMTVLGEIGVDLRTILGAAGIVGIAIGFASQTSVSNIISGLFLLSEKPFAVGDLIRVGDKMGVILSIDLMSIKIRTMDNLFIRLPNEKVLNTEVVNITRFPIRRLDFTVRVTHKEDVARIRNLLAEIARETPHALREPEPLVLFQNFTELGMEFLLGVWFLKTDFVVLKNSLAQAIKERFDAEGVEIPVPHRALYAGAQTVPMPIRIVDGEEL